MHVDWWTLALQTVNVLILVWILARFFFRPITAIVASRQDEARKILADADAARQRAEATQATADKARAEIEGRRQSLLDDARKEAQAEKARLLGEATHEAAAARAAAEAAAGRHRAEAEEALVQRAAELSLEIARRLLQRLRPEDALVAFADGLCREVSGLSSEMRAGLKPVPGRPLELRSSSALTDDQKRLVRQRLSAALGIDPDIAYRCDDALIAGVELHGPTTIVRNNWRADLDRIREELANDGRSRTA